MELIGNLKKQVESAKNRNEIKSMIEDAGMRLTDDELNMVAGGASIHVAASTSRPDQHLGYDPQWIELSKEERERAQEYKIVF